MIFSYGQGGQQSPQASSDASVVAQLQAEVARLRQENAELTRASQALVAKIQRIGELMKARMAQEAVQPPGLGTAARVPEVMEPEQAPEPVTRDQKLKAKDWWRNINPWGKDDIEAEIDGD